MNCLESLPENYLFKKIIKDWTSAFHNTELTKHLNDNKLKNIFIIGTSTHLCICDTIKDGIAQGFLFLSSSNFFDDGLPNIPCYLQHGFKTF
jgi:nicotinamidase-related amidase